MGVMTPSHTMFERWRPPSAPDRTFPDTREHGSIHPPKVGENSRDRHHRSAFWFAHTRRGGGAILHHRRIRLVLIRDWSPKMDGIAATIGASQTTSSTWPRANLERDVGAGAIACNHHLDTTLLGGDTTFVLARGGHALAIAGHEAGQLPHVDVDVDGSR